MKLPNFKRLIKTDYDVKFQDLIETLGFSLNTGIESLYQALNKSLTLKENLSCTVKDLEVVVDSNGNPKQQTVFTLDTNNKIMGITVLSAINLEKESNYVDFSPFVSFVQTNRLITINNIKGLKANQKYKITIVAFDL